MGSRRWQLPIAFALVALAAVSIGFYLNHFLSERDFLVAQNRRLVRLLSQRAATQLDGLASVLQTAAWELYRPGVDENVAVARLPSARGREKREEKLRKAIERSPYVRLVSMQAVEADGLAVPRNLDETKRIDPALSTAGGRTRLTLGPLPWHCDWRGRACALELVVDVDLDALFRALPHARLFEKVLFADASGLVLYTVSERRNGNGGRSGPFRHLDGLLTAASEPTLASHAASTLTSAPHRLRANVGGEDYWIVLEPVSFGKLRLPREAGSQGGVSGRPFWAVGGLVPADEFLDATRSVPTTLILLPTLAGILTVFLLYPWLKLWNCGAYEPFGRAELALAGFAFAALVGLITTVVYDNAFLTHRAGELDDRLRGFAKDVDRSYRSEIDAIVRELTSSLPRLAREYRSKDEFSRRSGVLTEQSAAREFAEYPFFDQIVWMDETGDQRVKWSARGNPTPRGRYADRPYFSNPASGRLWPSREKGCVGYFVQSIQSRTTGERTAVVSIVVPEAGVDALRKTDASPQDAVFACEGVPERPNVVTLVTQLWSIDRPIVPPGLEFAVLGPDDELLFYSDADARFFEMLEHLVRTEPKLRKALDRIRAGPKALETAEEPESQLRFSYRDRAVHVHVERLAETSWKLVVVSTNAEREAFNVAVLSRVAAGFLAYGAVVLAIALLLAGVAQWVFRVPVRSDTWLWAGPGRVPAYTQLALALAGVALVALRARDGALVEGGSWLPLELIAGATGALVVTTLALALRTPAERGETNDELDGPGRRDPPGPADWARAGVLIALLLGLALTLAPDESGEPVGGRVRFWLALGVAAAGIGASARLHEASVRWAHSRTWVRSAAFISFATALGFALGAVPIAVLFPAAARAVLPDTAQWSRDEFADSMQGWLERNDDFEASARWILDLCASDSAPTDWPLYAKSAGIVCGPARESEAGSQLRSLPVGEAGSVTLRGGLIPPDLSPPAFDWLHVALLAALGFAIWAVARRNLGLSSEWHLDVSDTISLSREANWLHIGPSDALPANPIDRSVGEGEDGSARNEIVEIDLSDPAVLASPPAIPAGAYVLVKKLESVLGSAAQRAQAIELITRLLGPDRRVHVVSEIDPLRWLSDGTQRVRDDVREDLVRWATLFSGFRVRHYEPDSRRPSEGTGSAGIRIQRECGVSPRLDKLAESLEQSKVVRAQGIEDRVLRCSRAEFVRLWELCTDRERAVLYLIAQGNVAAYPNRQTVAELLRRGLVVRDGGFWIASGAFRRFVLATVSAADEARWAGLAGAAGWHLWRNVLLVLMVLAVGFVFVTQRDVFVSLGAFLAVLGGLPLVARLVGGFANRGAAGAA